MKRRTDLPSGSLDIGGSRSRGSWVGSAGIGLMTFAGLASQALGQGTVTTSDGLALSLSASGSVSSLKINTTQYGSTMPSGFVYREPSLSSPNQAVNGSFESGSGTPTGWEIASGGVGTWSIDSGNASAGSRSMKLSIPGSSGQRSPDFLTIAQFPLKPNTPYRFSASMKTSGLSSGLTLYLLQQDSSGAWIQTGIPSLTGTNAWKTYAKTIITGPNAVQGYLKAYISSGYGTVWLDDVQLADVFGGDQPVAFGGTVTSPGGVLTQTANTNGLNLVAKFINVGSAIKVETTLTDTTGSDRGVEVAFRLPLDVAGWTWDKDFVTPTTIASGTRYENLDTSFAGSTLGHTHSSYPFATVRNSAAAFSLAVPMGPMMNRIAYDDTQGFRVTYDVGLSTATTLTPSTAKFTFWIYTHNPKWGMRSAAEKYYALNPTSFTTAATVLGAWAVSTIAPLSSIPDPEDFGFGYEEGNSNLDWDNANGVIGLKYLSFPEWDINILGYSEQPPYSVLAAALTAALGDGGYTVDSIPTAQMAAAVIASAPFDQNDLHQLSWHGYFWYGNRLQMYPAAPYSTLSSGTYGLRMQHSVDNPIAYAEAHGNTLGGIFLDNTTYVFGNIENYRKSLWAHNAHGPLSFSYRTGETVQYFGDSMFDFTKALRSHLNAQNKVLMASVNPGTYSWFAPNIDVIGGECSGADTLDKTYARRAMGYGKVWSNLMVRDASNPPTAADVLAYLRQGLLLGYFPGFSGAYWREPSLYERDRALFQKYMPLIKTVAQAGWKPVHYTTSTSSSTLIERLGNPSAGSFYVTAQNSGTSITAVTLTLDGAGLGIPTSTPVTAMELISNTSRSVTRTGTDIKISETLDPGEATVYKFTLAGVSTPTPTATRTATPVGSTPTRTATRTPTRTATPMPPTATRTATRTATPMPPTATRTATRTATPMPPTATRTPTLTETPVPPTATATHTPTETPEPPTQTPTGTLPPTGTPTQTPTETPVPPTGTPTHTPTETPVPPTATPTHTPTETPVAPTATPTLTPTETPAPPTATPTRTPTETPVPPTATPTRTPTRTPTPVPEAPIVSSISPSSGPKAAGLNVTIRGGNFRPGAAVRIGGVSPTSINIVNSTTITAKTPLLAAGTLNDVAVLNAGGGLGTLANGFFADFSDVPLTNPFHADIENVFRNDVAAGCGAGQYCPGSLVTRAQQAVFVLKAKFGPGYQPPQATGTVFADVPASAFAAAWIEALAAEGISGGCGGNNYCPNAPVSRAQMAVLLLKASHGSTYVPPAATGIFDDVPPGSFAAAWIEQLHNEEITAGCGDGSNYCPNAATPRKQMATFLVKTFELGPALPLAPRAIGPRVERP